MSRRPAGQDVLEAIRGVLACAKLHASNVAISLCPSRQGISVATSVKRPGIGQIGQCYTAQYGSVMEGHFFRFVAGFVVAVHAVVACSSGESHPPLASNACTTPPCSTPNLVSGGPTGTGGSSSLDAAAPAVDASSLACFTEPTSGLVLCARTPGCDFLLDRSLFPNCGFIPSSTGLDLECVCQTAAASTGLSSPH